MPLDSDIQNADERLHVQFYVNDKDKTHTGKTFIRIVVPGDQLNVVDRPMRENDKQRFPRQWLFHQMQNNEIPLAGTPLSDWHKDRPDEITEVQMNELHILRFQVVEQVAMASDAQLQRIGMGGVGLRSHAQAYLQFKRGDQASTELEQTKREMAELKEQMAQLLAAQTEKRGPGRPPKEA